MREMLSVMSPTSLRHFCQWFLVVAFKLWRLFSFRSQPKSLTPCIPYQSNARE